MNISPTNTFSRPEVRQTLTAAVAVAAFSLFSMASRAAEAAPGSEPAKKVVQYGDLNLSNVQAVQRLYRRIAAAAQDVCDPGAGRRPMDEQALARVCVSQSIERAVSKINQPALTAFYAEKNGLSVAAPSVLANR